MSDLHEQLSEQFYQWEKRGRGWLVFGEPVSPEPPFRSFDGHYQSGPAAVDDGRRSTFLSSVVQRLSRKLSTEPPPMPVAAEAEEEPEPQLLIRDALVELQTSLPAKLDISREIFEQFLSSLSLCREPIAFELVGFENRVTAQFAAHPEDAPLVRRQLQAYFPEAMFQPTEHTLENAWHTCSGEDDLVVEFGLAHEFMLPLASGKLDPFIGIVGALSELQPGELALFQVLFQPTHAPWNESITHSVTHADGKPFFVNSPELASAAQNKVSKPLYAAVVRVAVRTQSYERTLQLTRDLAGSLRVFADPHGNELIPLSNEDYPFEEHVKDVLRRQSRRSGMLLNCDELIGFVHLPSSAVRSAVFQRESGKSKAAPKVVQQRAGLALGTNTHAGSSVEVRLSPEQRVRHAHIIGASGTGKSTLLFNLIRQDIENGEGVAVLDPHGDLIEHILGSILPERIGDVVLFDASDETHSIGFNILTAHSDLEKTLLASDLVSIFQRLSASWGDQMGSVLQNAILAFLESSRGGTLADLRRFLLDAEFRNEFLATVRDPDLVYYWRKGFPQLGGNKSIGPVLTRLETFLAPKPVRYIVSQQANRLDFAEIMDSGKIFLAKLSQGQIGKENAFLLGSLLMSKFQQTAMSRQAQDIAARKDFWLYLDEFHHFITPSMAEIVGGARKYRMGLTLAHQELRQLQRDTEVASAVLSNCYTRVVFRVGDDDARKLAEGFSTFEGRDLQNLEIGEAICRVERSDYDFNLSVPPPEKPDAAVAKDRRQQIVAASRARYATARADIEAALYRTLVVESEPQRATPKAGTPKLELTLPPVSPTPAPTPAPPQIPPAAESPKASEVPNTTGSGKESPVVAAKPEPPRDLGRGGEQHKAIQERIQREAHALGFFAAVERQLADTSNEAADLVLRKGDLAIAVEIGITTTTDHEFKNVRKCLGAGFHRVAVVSPSRERLNAIGEAVNAALDTARRNRVTYHTPDEFISELRKLAESTPVSEPTSQTQRTTRGFKVSRHVPDVSPDERKAKEEAAIRLIAETMKRKP
ncbi:MAG: DUF87 domain-containing protein [Verrucomicrobia bacterium]|nr:MAG: DUF87 domain-containing protein [Verrucomicrobiota bacterium]